MPKYDVKMGDGSYMAVEAKNEWLAGVMAVGLYYMAAPSLHPNMPAPVKVTSIDEPRDYGEAIEP